MQSCISCLRMTKSESEVTLKSEKKEKAKRIIFDDDYDVSVVNAFEKHILHTEFSALFVYKEKEKEVAFHVRTSHRLAQFDFSCPCGKSKRYIYKHSKLKTKMTKEMKIHLFSFCCFFCTG